jgi:hypothetical protein
MSRKIVIAVITALLLAGTLLLLSGGSGGQSMATPSPSSSALPTPSGSIDPSLNDLPQPPVDPTTSCGLYKALVQSSVDVQVFAQAILDGADQESVARAADAYADATDDWPALALEIVARDPGRLDSYGAGALVEGIKIANSVPQVGHYLARVIRGEETEFSLEFVADGLAQDDAYGVLWAINGFYEDICLDE